ncbi:MULTISPECIES: acyltransferase [unclassified Sphingomonas]|uniref:acyltransferase family protein n=1 Tax=unclassified Sphingomonas TaxID=196159 RepID=UPI000E7571B7|nr:MULTISPECIES: acyltransferase [unclassified Sphingomonas]RKE43619.1 peptidoglycan/LPS O-acetylase OafA/YrhL [Sphingomonas sp. PP-CC-1A-547]TCM05843.1 peptidoglycan/LPS O-acetylase OafA/YrhL [Sphingomonas sp. PP-CC-3G-468]
MNTESLTSVREGTVGLPRAQTFAALDLIRGLAALAVVAWHAGALFGGRPGTGYLAVDVFFVLSGVVIANAYDKRLTAGMGVRRFMMLRVIRLYPLYVLGLLLAAAGVVLAIALHVKTSWTPAMLVASFFLSALFLPTPPAASSNGSIFPLNTPSWSLFFEMLINIAYVVLFPLIRQRSLLGVMAVAALWLAWIATTRGSLNSGFMAANWSDGIPRVFFSFGAGVYIARFRPVTNTISPLASGLVVLAALFGHAPGWQAAYDLVMVLVVFPLLVSLSLRVSEKADRLSNLLGNLSYPIYAMHVPLLVVLSGVATKLLHQDLAAFRPMSGIVFMLVLLITAFLLEKLYDLPIRRALGRQLQRNSPRQSVASNTAEAGLHQTRLSSELDPLRFRQIRADMD